MRSTRWSFASPLRCTSPGAGTRERDQSAREDYAPPVGRAGCSGDRIAADRCRRGLRSSANCRRRASPAPGFRRASRRSRRNSSLRKIIDQGHAFFGSISRGLALTVQGRRSSAGASPTAIFSARKVVAHSLPGCATAKACSIPAMPGISPSSGKGRRSASIFGAEGSRTMMLVYDLPATDAIYQRFLGMDGSAYMVGGFGMTALSANYTIVVPIRHPVVRRPAGPPMSAISTLRNAPPGIPSETMLRAPQHACPCEGGGGGRSVPL